MLPWQGEVTEAAEHGGHPKVLELLQPGQGLKGDLIYDMVPR